LTKKTVKKRNEAWSQAGPVPKKKAPPVETRRKEGSWTRQEGLPMESASKARP